LKRSVLIFLLNFYFFSIAAQPTRDTLTAQQLDFFIQLTGKLQHKLGFDSARFSDRQRIIYYRKQNSPVVEICYDTQTYSIDGEGRRQINFAADGMSSVCFTYDTVQKIFRYSFSGFGPSVQQTAFYKDTSIIYEIYSEQDYGGWSSSIELSGSNKLLYKPSEAPGISFIPHPLKAGKMIAVVANIEPPIQIRSF